MITTVFFGLLYLGLKLLNFTVPDWQFPVVAWEFFNEGMLGVVALNHYFALDTFFFVFGVMLFFEVGLFIVRFVFGLFALVRGAGSVEV